MPAVKFKSVQSFLVDHRKQLQNICNEIKAQLTESETTVALADKIEHIILNVGSPVSIVPMLHRIVFKGVKHQTQGSPGFDSEPLGKGHFRWDWKAYTLTDKEIKTVAKVLKYICN